MYWRPIETAPKDGTVVLLLRPGTNAIDMGYWTPDKYKKVPRPFWCSLSIGVGTRQSRDKPPTHWMPMPERPEPPV